MCFFLKKLKDAWGKPKQAGPRGLCDQPFLMDYSGESSNLAFQKKEKHKKLNDKTITVFLRFLFPSPIPTQEPTQVCL